MPGGQVSEKLKVILTHDIDWPPMGPGLEHIVARKERFDPQIFARVINDGFNPYNNIGPIMDLERGLGVRSSFYFRPVYDDGTTAMAYANEIGALTAGGWEVGAHLNDASSLESVTKERRLIGDASGVPPRGCRVHYLRLTPHSHSFMRQAGFEYDSSVMLHKDRVSPESAGAQLEDGLRVFPITIMDTYLFTYIRVPEEKVLNVFESAIEVCRAAEYMTVLWHDNSMMMKGGRVYPKICEMLTSRNDIECITAGEACTRLSGDLAR
jgi:hypothetical protein